MRPQAEVVAGYLVSLLLDPENGGSTFVRNVGELQLDFMASQPLKKYS
jgi:hypothetical protein